MGVPLEGDVGMEDEATLAVEGKVEEAEGGCCRRDASDGVSDEAHILCILMEGWLASEAGMARHPPCMRLLGVAVDVGEGTEGDDSGDVSEAGGEGVRGDGTIGCRSWPLEGGGSCLPDTSAIAGSALVWPHTPKKNASRFRRSSSPSGASGRSDRMYSSTRNRLASRS